MRGLRAFGLLVAVSAFAGCAEGAVDRGETEGGAAAATPALTSSVGEEAIGEASSAQFYNPCPYGQVYVAAINFCVAGPARLDFSPGAFGCAYGGVLSGAGNVICVPAGAGTGGVGPGGGGGGYPGGGGGWGGWGGWPPRR